VCGRAVAAPGANLDVAVNLCAPHRRLSILAAYFAFLGCAVLENARTILIEPKNQKTLICYHHKLVFDG